MGSQVAGMDRSSLLAAAFGLADTLTGGFDVIEHMTALCDVAVSAVAATDAAVLACDGSGELAVVTATGHEAWQVKLHQAQAQDGPCFAALETGRPVSIADLTDEVRWAAFTTEAAAAGYTATIAVPILFRGSGLGALAVLWADPRMPDDAASVAQALAAIAALGIGNADAHRLAEEHVTGLRAALVDAQTIELAKAVMAQALDIAPAEAFQRLRRWARNHNLRLLEAATRVAERKVAPETFAA